jgi:hypothetical protein
VKENPYFLKMIHFTEEEKIGAKVSLAVLLACLFVSFFLLVIITGGIEFLIFFPFDYSLIVLFIATAFWGSRAGIQIIRNHTNEDWVGIKTAFLIMLTFLISSIPMEIESAITYAVEMTLLRVLTSIKILIIPTVIYGILIGRRLKAYAKEKD